MLLAHKIQLYPNAAQARYLRQCMGARRYAYNALLAHFSQDGVKWSKHEAYRVFMTEVRQPWMADVTSRAPRNAIDDLHRAYEGFFRRVKTGKRPYGYPKFQKRGQHDRFALREKPKFRVDGRRLRLEKAPGLIKLREELRWNGTLHSVTISHKAGKFFAAIVVDTHDYETHAATREPSVTGVDLGLTSFAVLSQGGGYEHIPANQQLKASLKRLRRLQRQLSRKEKGSRRYERAKRRVARLHLRVSDQRNAMLHETSDDLTRRFSTLVIEDLAVKNLSRNRRMARAVLDSGWGEFRRQLTYKAALRGVHLIVVPRYFASSKTCANCGAVKDDLALRDRMYACDVCGYRQDRDENAADNLEHEAYGLHTLPADLKCALEMDQTHEVEPQRTTDKDRREEVYPEIRVDF